MMLPFNNQNNNALLPGTGTALQLFFQLLSYSILVNGFSPSVSLHTFQAAFHPSVDTFSSLRTPKTLLYDSENPANSKGNYEEGNTEIDSGLINERKKSLPFFDKAIASRRSMIVQSMAGLTAEAAWRQAVSTASALAATPGVLPSGTVDQLDAGRAAIIPNFLETTMCEKLRQDAQDCFAANQFGKFVYNKQGQAMDIWQMPSFVKRTDQDGPFVNAQLGNFELRQSLKAQMAQVKAELGANLYDRPTMLADNVHTHEVEYLRYGAGASLLRHTDEHHIELLYPGGSAREKKPNASRRSITWLLYLNEPDWKADRDGGQLRLYQRTNPAQNPVGARGKHLQIGWLKTTPKEQPVFLDPNFDGAMDKDKTCMLYTLDPSNHRRHNLSQEPFSNAALYLPGGDAMARKFMVSSTLPDLDIDATKLLHLIDAPKSVLAQGMTNSDGGETPHDVPPTMGTLVMFDSVSMPHEVLQTNRERWAVQGWFHEKLV